MGCYWLFRDINGASLGKLLLGLEVVQADGQPSTSSQRIKRNVPLCIGHFLFAIPIIGYFIGLPIIILVNLTEVIMLLTPHIVRTQELTESDLRPIYIGSQQNLGVGGPPPLIAAQPWRPVVTSHDGDVPVRPETRAF